MKPSVLSAFAVVCVFLPALLFAQGPLTPPGSPAPMMKTLEQIEPRIDLQRTVNPLPTDANNTVIISVPGSYYLSANLAVTKPNGLRVTAPGVQIDLNGFQISRASGSGGVAIDIITGADGCTVVNGSVAGFASGIQMVASGGSLTGIKARNCTGTGIFVGDHSEVKSCVALDNGLGIRVGEASLVKDCRASRNASTGIETGPNTVLAQCTAKSNGGTAGIQAGAGSTLTDCAALSNNSLYGIFASFGSALDHCTARANVGLSNQTASYGIFVDGESIVAGCSSTNNSSLASTATSSTGIGIFAGPGSLVRDCVVQGNKGDGIRVTRGCLVLNNQVDNAGSDGDGAGIHTTGVECRIEGNNVTQCDRGYEISANGCLILRNSARNNTTNYSIVANNRFGPIVDATATGSATVMGNGAPGTLTASGSDPWANFSF